MIEPLSSSLSIFRDDLFPLLGGGNKARKMMALHHLIKEEQYNALVTTGNIQSNHCRAVALYAKKYGLECTLVLHGNKKDFFVQSGNSKIIRNTNVNLVFCAPEDISLNMDEAMDSYVLDKKKPYYIYGGGHILEAAKSYIDVIGEIIAKDYFPDYIFVASGTGSTHAGILAGISKYGLKTKVFGISVARRKQRAESIVQQFYSELCDMYGIRKQENVVDVEEDFLCGGYGKYNEKIKQLEVDSMPKHNVFLDTTYTGKAFYGMEEVVKRESLTGKILFWYTGGQFNYFAK
ncbi:1-aminocyclopropane-1-carboxylate deaminase/D-cysteine desulfhydrase [Flagellimonas sp. 2504JD1-5]